MRTFEKCTAALLFVFCLSAPACNRTNSVLIAGNFRGKFDQIEKLNRERPGQLQPADLTAALGDGIPTSPADSNDLNLPPGMLTSELEWLRWECQNESLFAGFAGDRVSAISRIRR